MDGKVLLTAFKEPPRLDPIESWDNVSGDAGSHPAEARLDPVASAEAFNQLVELGYVAPPGPNVKDTVAECVRELKYNLARSYRDGNCCGEAADLAEELWTRWPKEHRFGLLLIDCLLPLRQAGRRRAAIEELVRRIERYQVEARAEIAHREKEKSQVAAQDSLAQKNNRRAQFEERQLRELAHGRPLLLEWLFVSQALLENQPATARQHLATLTAGAALGSGLRQRVAGAWAELGDFAAAQELLEKALAAEAENPVVHAQLADVHFKAGRLDAAIAAATESLSLLYFQPGLHALLGQALLEKQQFAAAEQALHVAVAQSPRNLAAHESLAKLYRQHLPRPDEAFAHEGRARSLKNELTLRQAGDAKPSRAAMLDLSARVSNLVPASGTNATALSAAFAGVDPQQIITVVSGLPRSGTSLMMQLLVAAGRVALTDGKRGADADNPLGYYEFEQVLDLAKETAWIPQARGKVIKIVAQLLPHLPRTEHYQVIFMERNLGEVIASQRAMLERQGRRGAELDEQTLAETYLAQLARLKKQLAARPELRVLPVNYNELLADAPDMVTRLAEFLGPPFDPASAASAIRPELRRQKF